MWQTREGPSRHPRLRKALDVERRGLCAAVELQRTLGNGIAAVERPALRDRHQDPAVASSVFVTMLTDSMGFFAFLGLATAFGLAS